MLCWRTRTRSSGLRLEHFIFLLVIFIGLKERFLEEEEIIEHFVVSTYTSVFGFLTSTVTMVKHNESQRIQWTMHRPRNGWYIRIRSPAFPPGKCIAYGFSCYVLTERQARSFRLFRHCQTRCTHPARFCFLRAQIYPLPRTRTYPPERARPRPTHTHPHPRRRWSCTRLPQPPCRRSWNRRRENSHTTRPRRR
jgi:hypothetical protein